MARVERSITAVDCHCGDLHEICFVANQGAVGGGYSYLCPKWGEVRSTLDHDKRRTVTLGLVDLPKR